MNISGFLVNSRLLTVLNLTGYYTNVYDEIEDVGVIYGDSHIAGYGYDYKIAQNFTNSTNGTMCHSKNNYTVCVDYIREPSCVTYVRAEQDVIIEVDSFNQSSNASYAYTCRSNSTEIMDYSYVTIDDKMYTVGGYNSTLLTNQSFSLSNSSIVSSMSPINAYLHDILEINNTQVLIGGETSLPLPFGYKYHFINFNTNISILIGDKWKSIHTYDNGIFSHTKDGNNLYIADSYRGILNVTLNNESATLNLISNVPRGAIFGISTTSLNPDLLIVYMNDIWFFSKSSKIWFRTHLKTPSLYFTQYINYKNYTVGHIKSPHRMTTISDKDTVSAYFLIDEVCLSIETVDLIPKRGSKLYIKDNKLYEGPGKRLFNYINESTELKIEKSNNCTQCI